MLILIASMAWGITAMTNVLLGQEIAARIELLALRAAVVDDDAVHRDRYVVGGDGKVLNRQETISVLAALPKPTVCAVSVTGGVVQIRCTPLDEVHGDFLKEVMEGREFGDERELFPDPSDTLVAAGDDARVMCIGREEMLVSRAEAGQWHRYFYNPSPWKGGYWMSTDELDNPYFRNAAPYVHARNKGAIAILKFAPVTPNDHDAPRFGEIPSAVVDLPDNDAGDIETGLVRLARAVVASTAPVDSTLRVRFERTAKLMESVWQGRVMPPEVAGFVRRFKRRE